MKAITAFATAFAALIVMWIALSIWYEVSMWQECRATPHSWFYCARILGSRG